MPLDSSIAIFIGFVTVRPGSVAAAARLERREARRKEPALYAAAPPISVGAWARAPKPAPFLRVHGVAESFLPRRDPNPAGPFRDRALRCRKLHFGLERITASFALPQMADVAGVKPFRPFGHDEGVATLRAGMRLTHLRNGARRGWARPLGFAVDVDLHGCSP